MTKKVKSSVAKVLTLVMVLSAVFSLSMAFAGVASAAGPEEVPVNMYLNLDTDYYGERALVHDANYGSWSDEYYNVEESVVVGDRILFTVTLYGVSDFKQAAFQSSANEYVWTSDIPTVWHDGGIPDGTTLTGAIPVTAANDSFSFKIFLANPVNDPPNTEGVYIENLRVAKLPVPSLSPSTYTGANIELDETYEGIATLVENGSVYEHYINVNDDYNAGDVYSVSYYIYDLNDPALPFKQVATQTELDGWSSFNAKWVDTGIPSGQLISGFLRATDSGTGSFAVKIHADNRLSGSGPIDVAITDLIVHKYVD